MGALTQIKTPAAAPLAARVGQKPGTPTARVLALSAASAA
jgi:hypothetical protein